MIPYMTFAGKNLLTDMQTVVDFSTSFGNPERSYEYVEIMGKNGSLVIDNNRFNDLEIDFPAFILKDFIPNYRNLMAFLNSQKGYQRLETSHEPDHYRKALFLGTVQPEPTQFLKKGSFTLPFRVHPQRYLKSGDIPVSASSQSNTYTGNPVSIDNPSGISAVSSLSVALNPQQNLNGYDAPWVGGAGKNKAQDFTEVENVCEKISDHTFIIHRKGTSISQRSAIAYCDLKANVAYTMTLTVVDASLNDGILLRTRLHNAGGSYASNLVNYSTNGDKTYTFTPTNDADWIQFYIGGGDEPVGAQYTVADLMIRLASETDATFEPYENVCPITGHTSASVTRTVDGSATDYTIDLNGTRYGGTVDLATGVLTVDTVSKTISSVSGWANRISNQNRVYATAVGVFGSTDVPYTYTSEAEMIADGRNLCDKMLVKNTSNSTTTPTFTVGLSTYIYLNGVTHIDGVTDMESLETWINDNPLQITYRLATPTTVQLTAQQISLLTGINYISSSDEMTVVVSEPSLLENPTLFESKPLIRVYGHGTLIVNNQYVTIAENPYEYIDIDCDIMDAFYGANNANQYVSLPNDYITLHSGNNYIAYDGTAQITPRWYEV